MTLLAVRADPRTVLSEALGILTGIMYLAPVDTAGRGNLCAGASFGCANRCLFGQGRGGMPKTRAARIAKTQRLFDDRDGFLDDFDRDVGSLVRKAEREQMDPAVRPNGTSDVMWEKIAGTSGETIFDRRPDVQHYDYTKLVDRMHRFIQGRLPDNYHLTFSRSETNEDDCVRVLDAGGTVAVVFGADMPVLWRGFRVIPETHDYRPADPPGTVVGLAAKGSAKKDSSGFVVWPAMGETDV